MPPFRYTAPVLAACLWPLLALATSPYDAELPPSGELAGIGVAECGSFSGGQHAGSSCEFALDARLQLHGDRLFGWRGSALVADVEAIGGGQPSAGFVGDAQGVSNIEAPWSLRPYEFYFSQNFAVTGLQFRIGLIDINDQFLTLPGTAELINPSFGLIPTLSLNAPTSTYPKPGLGATFEQVLGTHWHARVGIFQGHPEDRGQPFNHGAMEIGELQYDITGGGMVSLGAWNYAQPGGLDGSRGYGDPRHDWGTQLGTSLPLYGEKLRVFAQAGIAPEPQSFNPYYTELGVRCLGLLPKRPQDAMVLALASATLRSKTGLKSETTVELIYSAQVLSGVYLQPDIQYINRPLLNGIERPDALAAFIRIYANIE